MTKKRLLIAVVVVVAAASAERSLVDNIVLQHPILSHFRSGHSLKKHCLRSLLRVDRE